jgi:hypothetical protein
MKRGYNYAQAIEYVGVKRRTFDRLWRPRLNAFHQGTCLVFDRAELDRVFDELMSPLNGGHCTSDLTALPVEAQNDTRNGRPVASKGVKRWAETRGESTPTRKEPGKLTSTGAASDFASAASRILRKRSAG